MPRLRQNDRERSVGMIQAGKTHQAVADHFTDGKLTFRNFSVMEQDVVVCFVRINAFHENIDVNDNKQLIEFAMIELAI
jgi:hypothetical protein